MFKQFNITSNESNEYLKYECMIDSFENVLENNSNDSYEDIKMNYQRLLNVKKDLFFSKLYHNFLEAINNIIPSVDNFKDLDDLHLLRNITYTFINRLIKNLTVHNIHELKKISENIIKCNNLIRESITKNNMKLIFDAYTELKESFGDII